MTRQKRKPEIRLAARGDDPTPPTEFFAQHPYFHVEEFFAGREPRAAHRALHYHVSQGHLTHVRRGTYCWRSLAKLPDPYLLGSRLFKRGSGTVAYGSALRYRGRLPPPAKNVTFRARWRLPAFKWAGLTYRSVLPSKPLLEIDPVASGHVMLEKHWSLQVQVSTLETAYVDCLDRLDLAPKLDPLWDLFRAEEQLQASRMIDYALLLGSAVTIARVGLFMASHPTLWRNGFDQRTLVKHRPKTQALMDPWHSRYKDCVFWPQWNLMVPRRFYDRLIHHP